MKKTEETEKNSEEKRVNLSAPELDEKVKKASHFSLLSEKISSLPGKSSFFKKILIRGIIIIFFLFLSLLIWFFIIRAL